MIHIIINSLNFYKWEKTMIDYSNLLENKKTLHFVGIGGSGMFPLVQILHAFGYEIQGSDVNEGDIITKLKKMGIKVYLGHNAQNVNNADLVVYSAAISKDNAELIRADELNITSVERSIMLSYVANLYKNSICISGTHGKTTTTAMLTQTMLMANKDSAAVIGGKLPYIDAYGRHGKGDEIIVEACEYNNTFLHLQPAYSVILNIDEDHMEFFKTLENLRNCFLEFANSAKNAVILNCDDENTMLVAKQVNKKIITFGKSDNADYKAVNIKEHRPSFYSYDVEINNKTEVSVVLNVPGEHNVLNSLAVFACAHTSGCTASECAHGISAFKGAGRRFEILGEVNGITIADDYAHHPAEIEVTLNAAKKMDYKRVFAVHQPFTYTRTKRLLNDFANVLKIADFTVLSQIMGSREKAEDYDIRAKHLAQKIPGCVWFETFDEIVEYVLSNAQKGDLIITLGCGDIYKAAKKMIESNK